MGFALLKKIINTIFRLLLIDTNLPTLLALAVCWTCVIQEPSNGLTHRRVFCFSVVEHQSAESECLWFDSSGKLWIFFLCLTFGTRRKTNLLISPSSLKVTIFPILINWICCNENWICGVFPFCSVGHVWWTGYRWFWSPRSENLHGRVHGRLYIRYLSAIPLLHGRRGGLFHSQTWKR